MIIKNLIELLGLFGIMSGDVRFILDELKSFEVDFDDLEDEFSDYREDLDNRHITNTLIECIYNVAVRNTIKKEGLEEYEDQILENLETYTNSIDSHLYITLPKDGTHEAHNIEDLKDLLNQFCIELTNEKEVN